MNLPCHDSEVFQWLVGLGVFAAAVMLSSGIRVFAPKSAFEPFRRLADFAVRRPLASVIAAALLILGPVRDAATKVTNTPPRGASLEGSVERLDNSALHTLNSPLESAPLRFTAICPGSNSISLALAWNTNFSPARAWLELHSSTSLVSGAWLPHPPHEIAMGETNAVFEVAATNGPPPAAFYRAYVDTLGLAISGCNAYLREDGTILRVATHTGGFPVTISRPDRPAGLSAPDPAFAANPFAHAEGLSYDPDSGTLHVASNGTYRLPDGSELFVSSEPTVTFGIAHAYSGPEYPLDSPALREGWTKGGSPLTGCSCVPEADFGDGLVVSGRSPPTRSGGGQGGLPDGMRVEWEFEPGGVWATCFAWTNVVWRKWAPHNYLPEYGGRTDGLDEPDEDKCECGDGAEEGPSLGSVRFRIPLGSPYAGITSGFLYFSQSEEFAPTPSSFRLMARGDASVTDTTEDGVRTVACHDFRGRTLVLAPVDGEDAVEIEVRDTASGSLQHTWKVGLGYYGGMTFEKTSVLWNTMECKTISCVSDGWEERDEISDVTETRSVREEDGVTREVRIIKCGDTVVSHTVTDSAQVGSGASAVMRQVERRELGAGDAWKTARATYWNDAAHPLRHGCPRLVSGDDREWAYTAFDDSGRETFRLEQMDGSDAPADAANYSLANLPQGVDATATVLGYEPLAGDSAHTNDFRKARTESKYAVLGGAATLVSRTWRRYVHSETNGLPVVTVTTVRACSQSAEMDDPGNAVSSETHYDAESGAVPYMLRGRPVSAFAEDGVETRYETEVAGDVVRTVERRFLGGVEAKARRVSEIDINHGNLLYEAEALSSDGTEFGWREHIYDEKNRLRFTAYDDGSSETNEYSCCRLLWSTDRRGARRVRHAWTGTDHLEHAFVDESVKDLPKDEGYYGPWRSTTFKLYSPVTVHRFDGFGRETNTVVRTGRIDGGTLSSDTGTYSGLKAETRTTYTQGVSDVSETVGYRGLVTRRTVLSAQSAETTVEKEFEPGESSPSVVVTNISVRGGGTVEWRTTAGRGVPAAQPAWTCRRRFSEYGAGGCRVDFDITESSGGGTVTNSVVEHDFLGRVVRRTTPTSSEVREYDGASPRVLSILDEVSGVAVTNLYDEVGERVGSLSGGVEEMRRTDYEFSNVWWRVERSARVAGGVTNSPSATWTRLTGLSDAVRSEVVEFRGGAFARRTATSYDADAGTERETVSDAADGESWTVSKFGYPIEAGTPTHTFANFYGPVGKVFVRTLACQGESTRRSECVLVDALGDELARVVCDRQNIENAPGSEFAYDCRGNRSVVTNAVGAATFASHDPDGNVVAESGATYPREADYDTAGRRVALRTFRDAGGSPSPATAGDETTWAYDAATGACTNKTYADGSQVAYTHTPDGLSLRTTYASGRWRENAYDSRRQLAQVSHSDSTLDYAISRDAFGRATNVVDAAGNEWRYEYDAFDSVLREEAVTVGRDAPIAPPMTAAIARSFDSIGRPTSLALSVDGTPKDDVGYEYGDDGLLGQLVATNAQGRTFSVAYSNHAGRCIGYAITTPDGDTIRRSVNRDFYRQSLVNSCSTTFNDTILDSHTYAYDALSRPTSRTSSGATTGTTGVPPVASSFAYNDRSEVVSATIGTNHFLHAYDTIGNQTNHVANAATNAFTHNALNQMVGRSVPTAPQAFAISHDLDGNMTSDGLFIYSYDAANRLASVSSNGVVLVANEYDYRGRRMKKTTPTTETTFVYDGWNLMHETVATISGATTNTTEVQYFWGVDLSESLQGAGGVGGLLAVSIDGSFYFPAYDNIGNVTRYIDESGNVVAAYEYDDFGRLISSSGPMTEVFRIRFSTKYCDSETGLYYYGYRFYSPALMRWLNRDPIEEEGGLNLYGFCGNDTMSKYDFLGMETSIDDWELIGEISEAHSWNCIEWKSMSKDWKTRRKSSRGEVGEGVKDGGTQKNYVRHFKEITFKLDIHVPERCVNPFSYGIVSVLGMSNDPKSYWCLSYAPLRIYKKCINRKMKYLLKITIRNLDRHPRFSNTPEIHHPDKEGKTFEYGPI